MEGLKLFWTWAYVLGFGAFAVMALIIIPLGMRDLIRLLKDLGSHDRDEGEKEPEA